MSQEQAAHEGLNGLIYNGLAEKHVLPHNTPSTEAVDQGQVAKFDGPVYDQGVVEARSGITGHTFLGTISTPSTSRSGVNEAKTYLVFQAGTVNGKDWDVPLVFSSANHSLADDWIGKRYTPQAPGSVTLIARDAFDSLVTINGHNPLAWDAVDPQSVGPLPETTRTEQKRNWARDIIGRLALSLGRRELNLDFSDSARYAQCVYTHTDVIEPPTQSLGYAVPTSTALRYGQVVYSLSGVPDGVSSFPWGSPEPGNQRFSVLVDTDRNVRVLNTSFTEDVTLAVAA